MIDFEDKSDDHDFKNGNSEDESHSFNDIEIKKHLIEFDPHSFNFIECFESDQ